MKQKTIIFDCDGVLADFIGGFTARAHELFPEVPVTTTAGQHSWNGFPGMDRKQINLTWESVKADPSFWRKLDPLVGPRVFDRIYSLTEHHRVYFVTSRVGIGCKRQTEYWLAGHGVVNPTVIISKRKGEFAKAVEADYSIEDKANNASCIDWLTDGKTQSFLLNRPYNQGNSDFIASNVRRLDTVDEYIDVCNGLLVFKEAA